MDDNLFLFVLAVSAFVFCFSIVVMHPIITPVLMCTAAALFYFAHVSHGS